MLKLIVSLLAMPPTTTLTGPVVARVGTVAVIWVADQLTIGADQPLMTAILPPWVVPKPLPLICTCVPEKPLPGDTLVTTTLPTVKDALVLLLAPLTVTLIGPVVALAGTEATICGSLQLDAAATTLLNEIVLDP